MLIQAQDGPRCSAVVYLMGGPVLLLPWPGPRLIPRSCLLYHTLVGGDHHAAGHIAHPV